MRYFAPILLLAGLQGAWAQTLAPEKLFENLSASVWYVWGIDAQERRVNQGSGVVIGPGKVVTNCHVLNKVRNIYVQRENVTYTARLEHAESGRDICLLDIKNFTAPAVKLGSARDAKVGQKVYAIGSPLGLESTFSEGIISGLRGPDGKDPLLQNTAAITSGSSGGGLFDAEGRLIGITTFMHRGSGNLNFAVPVEWVREAGERMQAAEERRKQTLAARSAGVQTWTALPGMPTPGSTWKYRYTDRAFGGRAAIFSVTAFGVDGLLVREAIKVEGDPQAEQLHASITANEARFTERALPGGILLSEFAPYFLASTDAESAAWPAIPGMADVDVMPWKVSGRAVGWETVTVPAGTFRALKITVRGVRGEGVYRHPALTAHDGREFEYAAWYAEEAMRMVKMERTMVSRSRTTVANETMELLSYHPR